MKCGRQRFQLSVVLIPLLFLGLTVRGREDSYEQGIVKQLDAATLNKVSPVIIDELAKLALPHTAKSTFQQGSAPLLFSAYPQLQHTISYAELCDLPTPIVHCKKLGAELGVPHVYMKNDALTGPVIRNKRLFGGNKPRKLEFVLADARAHNASAVLTFGCIGSSHALATAIYAPRLGMRAICMLKDEPNSYDVRRTLLMHLYYHMHRDYGTKLRHSPSYLLHCMAAADECLIHKQRTGTFPTVIPTGASNTLGILGFVNAAFELKEQIKAGIVPEPDTMYVALGSLGTAAGLLLGMQAAGLKIHLVAVAIAPANFPARESRLKELFAQANELLHNADPTFPMYEFPQAQFTMLTGFQGDGYALFTPEGVEAKNLLMRTEQIKLDGTYTAKAFAGMLDHIAQQNLHNKSILFWNTYCGLDFEDLMGDYKQLPLSLHKYFENDVQLLDR